MASQNLINIIIKAQDQASQTAEKVESKLRGLGTVSNALGKIPGFDALKTKLTGVSNTLKTKFGGAIDGVRSKLTSLSNGSSGLVSSMNFLKGAVSMTAGMIGFELVSSMASAAREAINAASKLDYFSQRLGMTSSESTKFKSEIADLQREFRKVDMTAVGATAEEIAVKMDLPKNKLTDLTRMTAVMSSTFVKEGRTQEDAVLAVGDALDGQFRRLQEIGITQDKLKQNGWSGELSDQAGLIDALNKTMQDMGYEQTAKDITTLDEAYTALTVAGGQLLQQVLIPITPALVGIIEALISATDVIGPFITSLTSLAGSLPDWIKDGAIFAAFGAAIMLVGAWINATLIPAFAAATLAALDFAAAMLANPLTWVVVALMAIVLAIYEVGKAFGWWSNIQGMLSAVWSGINRLWSAFINHPDVQALLSAIGFAFNLVSSAVGRVISYVLRFFNVNTNGKFDVIRALITAVGATWKAITAPIRTVIAIIKLVTNAFKTNLNKVLNFITTTGAMWVRAIKQKVKEIVQRAYDTLSGLPGKVSSALGGVKDTIVKPFQDAYTEAKKIWDNITSLGGVLGGEIVDGVQYYGGEEIVSTNTSISNVDNSPLVIEDNINLVVDLRNVPSGVDTNALIEAFGNQSVLNALVDNRKFQDIDARVKTRLNSKVKRSRGV